MQLICILIVKFIYYHQAHVFLIAIHFYRKWIFSEFLIFWTEGVPDLRVIDIEKVCNSLSAKHTETILGWHLFTECDETARFYIKSRIYFNKAFKSPSPEVLKSLGYLGTDTS